MDYKIYELIVINLIYVFNLDLKWHSIVFLNVFLIHKTYISALEHFAQANIGARKICFSSSLESCVTSKSTPCSQLSRNFGIALKSWVTEVQIITCAISILNPDKTLNTTQCEVVANDKAEVVKSLVIIQNKMFPIIWYSDIVF